MNPLLFWIPTALQAHTRDLLEERGVADLLPEPVSSRHVNAGPDGQQGLVLVHGEHRVGYFPESQVWTQHKDGVQVGFDPANPPGPEHLARPEQIDGHPVELADGNGWVVPIVRSVMHGSMLPQQLVLDTGGNWTGRPLEIYAQHEQDAERIWEQVIAEAGAAEDENGETVSAPEPMQLDDMMRIAVDALAVNYRIDKWIVSALGLMTTRHPMQIGRAMVDWPAVEEAVKNGDLAGDDEQKKSDSQAPDTSATSGGVTD